MFRHWCLLNSHIQYHLRVFLVDAGEVRLGASGDVATARAPDRKSPRARQPRRNGRTSVRIPHAQRVVDRRQPPSAVRAGAGTGTVCVTLATSHAFGQSTCDQQP